MRRRAALAPLALALPAFAALAAAPAFRWERAVTPGGPGPRALAVDVPLLTGAAPGLSDLRLFDASGREVPWLLIPPPDPAPSFRSARLLPIAPTKTESGFEADLGRPFLVDRIRIEGLGAPLLKRYRLEGSGDRARFTLLVADGTLFDLPDEKLKLLTADFPAGEYRYLRLTWDDRRSARPRLPGSVEAREAKSGAPPAPAKVPALFERRASEPGKSRFRIRLPGPHLPLAALELGVGGGPLLRTARVTEPRLADGALVPSPLGEATLRRAERDGQVAADLRIPVRAPEGTDLDLVVDDGDNPPLALESVTLDLGPLPWIYLESDGGPLTARFGAPALAAPRYDLEAGRAAAAASHPPAAAWGERRGAAPAEASAAPPIPTEGAPIDPSRFRFRREIPGPGGGLVSLRLDAAVLAHARDLSGLRVVDARGRQVPYLLEASDEPLTLALAPAVRVPPAKDAPNLSRYDIALPFDTLPDSRLVLRTPARVFDRQVRVLGRRPGPDARSEPVVETLAASRWAHADPETPAPSLVLPIRTDGLSRVELEVDEGDNTPLPLSAPELLLPSHRLRFFAPPGAALTLCYGASGVAAPRYDLSLLAPRLVGAPVREVALAPEPAAPAAAEKGTAERRLFWGVLVAAVALLLAVTARMFARPAGPDV